MIKVVLCCKVGDPKALVHEEGKCSQTNAKLDIGMNYMLGIIYCYILVHVYEKNCDYTICV